MEHTIVFTTAHVFEVDTVREAFNKANIPFYVQSEALSGVTSAFEASPASGLGRRWHVFVPTNAKLRAKNILSTLHLSLHSDSKPFFESDEASFKKNVRKALLLVSQVIIVLGYLLYRAFVNH